MPCAPEPRVHLNRKAKPLQQAPQKPSDMLISRTGLFYCATFPSKPGLPSSRAPILFPESELLIDWTCNTPNNTACICQQTGSFLNMEAVKASD